MRKFETMLICQLLDLDLRRLLLFIENEIYYKIFVLTIINLPSNYIHILSNKEAVLTIIDLSSNYIHIVSNKEAAKLFGPEYVGIMSTNGIQRVFPFNNEVKYCKILKCV